MKLKKRIIFILICVVLLCVVLLLYLHLINRGNADEKDYPKLDIYEAVMEGIKDNDPDNSNVYRYYIYNNNGDYYYVYVHEETTIKGSKEDIIDRGDINSVEDFNTFEEILKKHLDKDGIISYTYKLDDAYQIFDKVDDFKKCFGEVK